VGVNQRGRHLSASVKERKALPMRKRGRLFALEKRFGDLESKAKLRETEGSDLVRPQGIVGRSLLREKPLCRPRHT